MAQPSNRNLIDLYNARAHVFQIDPETKNSWLQKGELIVTISLLTDSEDAAKKELRILGTGDDGENVLDAIILPRTVFTKRSHKFGQWSDPSGMVYGLGFNKDEELVEFMDTFQRLQRDHLSQADSNQNNSAALHSQHQATASSQVERITGQTISNSSETNGGRFQQYHNNNNSVKTANLQQYSNTIAHLGHQQQQIKRQQQQQQLQHAQPLSPGLNNGHNETAGYPRSQSMFGLQSAPNNNNNMTGKLTPENDSSSMSQADWQLRDQLKAERARSLRLEHALKESAAEIEKCHTEITILKTNNSKLTIALKESGEHIDEWNEELTNLREENKELKRLREQNNELQMRLLDLNSAEDPDKFAEYKRDLQKHHVELQTELKKKDSQIDELRRTIDELKSQNGQLDTSNSFVDIAISSHQKAKFDKINAKLEAKLGDLLSVQKEFAQLVDKMYH